jgi:hypothetical protein
LKDAAESGKEISPAIKNSRAKKVDLLIPDILS